MVVLELLQLKNGSHCVRALRCHQGSLCPLPSKHQTLSRCWSEAGPLFASMTQHRTSIG